MAKKYTISTLRSCSSKVNPSHGYQQDDVYRPLTKESLADLPPEVSGIMKTHEQIFLKNERVSKLTTIVESD